jgi:DNA-binding SARP family transcriptional activator
MATLTIHMFGGVTFERDGAPIAGFHSGKSQELFCYLLLQRQRPLAREALASLFWGECTTAQSRKYLRQTLWQLQGILDSGADARGGRLVVVDGDSVGIDPQGEMWLDVETFEHAFAQAQNTLGDQLKECQFTALRDAVQLYRGDLLEGWYDDWCLFQRERLQNMYLMMLDKLMCYCESRSMYQTGLEYGERVLGLDRAHERTHQKMVKLLYLSGDRAGALRQYDRCVRALAEELDVKPAAKTQRLYEQIRADRLEDPGLTVLPATSTSDESGVNSPSRFPLPELLSRLCNLEGILADAHDRVQQNIQVIETFLHRTRTLPLPQKRRSV